MPKVKAIGRGAFIDSGVIEFEFGEDLETIGSGAFRGRKLRRIAIPLKDDMFQLHDWDGTYTQFLDCPNLATVDLVGGIHKTVASLHLESWRNEMNAEIQSINQILPGTDLDEKTNEIRQWVQSVISKIDHYKAEHRELLKEAMSLLELALWKANLDENVVCDAAAQEGVRVTRGQRKRARKDRSITSGASVVIKNVLPYLIMD